MTDPTSTTPTPLPADRIPTLRVIPMPLDLNPGGSVFGGWMMSHLDMAGSVPAVQRAQGPVVTVAGHSLLFIAPVHVGDLVSFYASIVKTGTTSMTIGIEVFSNRQRRSRYDEVIKVAEATLVFVAVDDAGKPRPLPSLDEYDD